MEIKKSFDDELKELKQRVLNELYSAPHMASQKPIKYTTCKSPYGFNSRKQKKIRKI